MKGYSTSAVVLASIGVLMILVNGSQLTVGDTSLQIEHALLGLGGLALFVAAVVLEFARGYRGAASTAQ